MYSEVKRIDYETAKETYLNLKETIIEVWEVIKEKIVELCDDLMINRNKINHNWYVPVKIDPPPMPDIEMPKIHLARSDL